MQLAAAGARAELLQAHLNDGFGLALRTDAFLAHSESEGVSTPGLGNLAGATGRASRLRAALEGSRAFALGGGGTLTPSLTLGLRQDGGDGDTGSGVELGAGLGWSDPKAGVSSELRVSGLTAHESGKEEWSASGSLRFAPGPSGRGASLSLAPSLGADGRDRLWESETSTLFDEDRPGARLDAEFGYGFSLGARLTGTPYVGLGMGGAQEWRLGWRLGSDRIVGALSLEAVRSEAGVRGPENGLALRGDLRW